jgi:hypothetical protein
MNRLDSGRRFAVLAAVAVVVLLAGLFAVRVAARSGAPVTGDMSRFVPPSGTVPPPATFALDDLPTPFCWGCSTNRYAPLDFQIDLDWLAPLGDGEANAALWFKEFAQGGPRFETDAEQRSERLIEISIEGTPWRVLPGDDPLLIEAEPWVDQARCRFYPDVFEIEGMATRIPNLLLMLDFARSWVVRGKLSSDPEAAREDFRRAIRLGRLLRQDDAVIIQDLVAIACIRVGAEALYEQAQNEGAPAMMLATARVLADKDAMRLATMQRISASEPVFRMVEAASPTVPTGITDDELEKLVENVRRLQDRRFKMEGLLALQIVMHLGTPAQRETATDALGEFAQDPDRLFADTARRYRDLPADNDLLRSGDGDG